MKTQELKIQPITTAQFAPFGEIIHKNPANQIDINDGRFDRFQELATIDTAEQGGFVNISILECQVATTLPLEIKMLERHPLGSQAFMPLSKFQFVVVVAPPGESVDGAELRAFETNGHQGINMRRGVWHLPLIGQKFGQEFLVVDRGGGSNYDEYFLPSPIVLASTRTN